MEADAHRRRRQAGGGGARGAAEGDRRREEGARRGAGRRRSVAEAGDRGARGARRRISSRGWSRSSSRSRGCARASPSACATRDGLCSVCHVRLRPQVFQQVRAERQHHPVRQLPAHPLLRAAAAADRTAPSSHRSVNQPSLFGTPGGGAATANIDGGSRGNPGPAGYGVRIEQDDGTVVELKEVARHRHQQRRRVQRPAGGAALGGRARRRARCTSGRTRSCW